MTRVNRFPHDGEEINIVFNEEVSDEENCFSILIGKNGIGKSRLLSEITKTLIKFGNQNISFNDSITSRHYTAGGYQLNHTVIAVSTSPFDKFPNSRRRTAEEDSSNYRYIGMRGDGPYGSSSSIALISSAARGLLEKIKKGSNSENLIQVFKTLGLTPSAKLILKPSYIGKDSVQNSNVLSQDSSTYLDLLCYENDYGIFIEERYRDILKTLGISKRHKILSAVRTLHEILTTKKAIELEINFEKPSCKIEGKQADSDLIGATLTLMNHGFMRIMDMELEKLAHGALSLRRASSGEQCLLVIMLGIAGHIKNDSVILIDEPEISLHPEWQEEFMTLLISAFSAYKGCQFIIATHSPQIISRLNKKGCFITSLSQKRTYGASEFLQKSADYQLAELFDAPGTMNEYISRLSFNLLAKIKSEKHLDVELIKNLNHLKNSAQS